MTLGIAVDVGTTTVAALLVDLSTGNILARESAYNRQIELGTDIGSRVALCCEAGNVAELQRLLIKKTDSSAPQDIQETMSAVRELNPVADWFQTVRCDVELDLFAEKAPRGLQGEYAKCRDPNYETFVTDESFDGEALAAFVQKNADDIYRVKGTLADEFFDYSTTGAVRTPQPGAAPALAWIVKGGAVEKIMAGLKSL